MSRIKNRPLDWPDWFEPKGYPHFDQPVRDPVQVRHLVESEERIANHSFLPFIHFEKMVRKYKRDAGEFVKKPRPLSYASHLDSQIFRRYYLLLSACYEQRITKLDIANSILAYRRFDPRKCNIHFANDAFCFIERNAPCVAMAYDVKDFFESLCHKMIKQQWKETLNLGGLPEDHYAVFKAVTRYSWVEREPLFHMFGITKKKLAEWRGPICSPKEFRDRVRTSDRVKGLIKVKMDGKGVPQGSAISAMLSNIYMIPVDTHMAAVAKERNGLYLRYSDDILLVCMPDDKEFFQNELQKQMANVSLVLHTGPGKSTIATFEQDRGQSLKTDRPLQYLGFTFDGNKVLIRSQTISRYHRKMRKAIRREKYLAACRAESGGNPTTRRKLLYSRYSHLGTRNFISYAMKANEEMNKSDIRGQVKRHWRDLNAMLEFE